MAHALQAAQAGADVISAQVSESGGFSGLISTLASFLQVVDAVAPLSAGIIGQLVSDAERALREANRLTFSEASHEPGPG